MEALPLRAGRANCMSNIQQDMIEQTLAILASMMQRLRMTLPSTVPIVDCGFPGFRFRQYCYRLPGYTYMQALHVLEVAKVYSLSATKNTGVED
jgi:hypothetical protein